MNARQVRWDLEAGAEVEARWYRERSAAAAERFVEEIKQAIETILEAPRRWLTGSRSTRKVKLPCFPFLVVYRESDQAIEILAIAHGRRRPGYWKERA
jgi:toxin ParE1/3/4